jgi:hypothetical protein
VPNDQRLRFHYDIEKAEQRSEEEFAVYSRTLQLRNNHNNTVNGLRRMPKSPQRQILHGETEGYFVESFRVAGLVFDVFGGG